MPHFAANLTFLFTEIPFMERFSAAQGGFSRREFMFPYDYLNTCVVVWIYALSPDLPR